MFPLYTEHTPAPQTEAAPQTYDFFVTVDYRTKAGSPSSWSGIVRATWDTVHDVGQERARRARRALASIDGGRAVLATAVKS